MYVRTKSEDLGRIITKDDMAAWLDSSCATMYYKKLEECYASCENLPDKSYAAGLMQGLWLARVVMSQMPTICNGGSTQPSSGLPAANYKTPAVKTPQTKTKRK